MPKSAATEDPVPRVPEPNEPIPVIPLDLLAIRKFPSDLCCLVQFPPACLSSSTSFLHRETWIISFLCETSARRLRSLKECMPSGLGGLRRHDWISDGSCRRFINWVTRAREIPSRIAILAFVSFVSSLSSCCHERAKMNGWMLSCGSSCSRSVKPESSSTSAGGKAIG